MPNDHKDAAQRAAERIHTLGLDRSPALLGDWSIGEITTIIREEYAKGEKELRNHFCFDCSTRLRRGGDLTVIPIDPDYLWCPRCGWVPPAQPLRGVEPKAKGETMKIAGWVVQFLADGDGGEWKPIGWADNVTFHVKRRWFAEQQMSDWKSAALGPVPTMRVVPATLSIAESPCAD